MVNNLTSSYFALLGMIATIMATKVNKEESKNYGCFICDEDTNGKLSKAKRDIRDSSLQWKARYLFK